MQHSTPGITETRKKGEQDIELENINLIETFFSIYKNSIFHIMPVVRFLKIVLFRRFRHLKKKMLKGRGSRGGKDEKIKRMWLGREIVVVGLTPLPKYIFRVVNCTLTGVKVD